MTNNTVFLIVGVFAISIIMIYTLSRSNSNGRRWSIYFLCMSLLSIICSISMGVNYLAAYTGRQDGIALTGWLARLIIGDDRWSLEMFYNYYAGFTTLSIVFVILFFTAVIYENKRLGRY